MKPSVALRSHPAQAPGSVRRFSLLDAMALIAAASVGLALDRAFWSLILLCQLNLGSRNS